MNEYGTSYIVDSGTRREFETGAVRDIAEGKGRCDLLPLGVIGRHMEDNVLKCIAWFQKTKTTKWLWQSFCHFCNEEELSQMEALLEVSHHYEDGLKKYGERNWEKGIPLHSFIDSAVRHYLKHRLGETDERHDRAFIWNILGAMWTAENKPEMDDITGKKNQLSERVLDPAKDHCKICGYYAGPNRELCPRCENKWGKGEGTE